MPLFQCAAVSPPNLAEQQVNSIDEFQRLVNYTQDEKQLSLSEYDSAKHAAEEEQREAARTWSKKISVVKELEQGEMVPVKPACYTMFTFQQNTTSSLHLVSTAHT